MADAERSLRATLGSSGLSLLASSSTLVCCALPALLVALGAGATLVTLTTRFPQLIWLSEHKLAVFGGAATMLVLATIAQWRARALPCPVDPASALACARARRVSACVHALSVLLFAVGTFFAFIAPWLLRDG
ncbi:hypothetical protein [Methyloversatilis thermotolerans]|uniref:hypothetical protein n=1 Tax=Methyloversatilis thermotolerans TaxID=1346290 RepID=UPI00037DDB92|nr:hypothetical protein [Methyloversatilis thermotolerans]